MRPMLPIVAFAGLSMAGCGGTEQTTDTAYENKGDQSVTRSQTTIAGRQTTIETRVDEADGGVRIRVSASGIAAGEHGMHVHEIGRCDGPAYTSAGAHWNPTAKKHGRDNAAGAHLGDAPNLVVGADGGGSAEVLIPGARLNGGPQALYDEDGAALLIHAEPDDYRTDPSGDSGDRILCSVLKAAK